MSDEELRFAELEVEAPAPEEPQFASTSMPLRVLVGTSLGAAFLSEVLLDCVLLVSACVLLLALDCLLLLPEVLPLLAPTPLPAVLPDCVWL